MADRTVRVRYEAVIGQYEAALAKAGISTKGFGSTVDSVMRQSERSYKSMFTSLRGVGVGTVAVGAAVAVAGVAIVKAAREGMQSYIELVDEVKAYKNATGASAEESSKMVAVARVLGMSTDSLATGMLRLSRQVAGNQAGLASYGVAIAKNKDGHVDLTATLMNVADAYQATSNGQTKNEIAMEAFGMRGMRTMIPMLKQSREQLEEFWAAAGRHNEIVNDADLRQVFEYKVAIREAKEAREGLTRSLGEHLVRPARNLALITEDITEGRVGRVIKELIPGLGGVARAHRDDIAAAKAHASAEQSVADAMEEEQAKTDALVQGLDELYAGAFSVSEAQDKFNSDLADFADKVQAAKLGGDAYAASLDESTSTGRENAGMVRGLTKDIMDTAKAARTSGEDVESATSVQRSALVAVLEQLGFNKAEAQNYANVLAELDGLVVTQTVDLDIGDALRKLDEFKRKYGDVVVGITRPDLLNEHDRLVIEAGEGVPDSIASRELLDARAADAARRWREAEAANEAAANMPPGPAEQAERERQQRDREQRAREADQAARDAQRQRDSEMGNRFELGGISADAYKAYLQQRLAQTREYSDEWATIMHEIDRVNHDVGAAWIAAQEQINAAQQRWMDVLRMQHEFGERSTADYLEQLRKRLVGLEKYSAEWESTMREIRQLEDETSQSILDIIAAVDKQRKFDQAFYGAESQRNLQAARESVVVQAGSTSTRTYSPNVQLVSSGDPSSDMRSVTQRMRDDAFLAGI